MTYRNGTDSAQKSSLLNGLLGRISLGGIQRVVEQAFILSRGEDLDLREKQTVYHSIVSLLQQEFAVEFSACLKAVYQLCEEPELDALVEDFEPAEIEGLVRDFQSNILKIQVIYYPAGQLQTFERLVEVFFCDAENVTVNRVRSTVSRDDLPADMRAYILRQGNSTLTFKIYTQESEL
jgi:hypothetical protein